MVGGCSEFRPLKHDGCCNLLVFLLLPLNTSSGSRWRCDADDQTRAADAESSIDRMQLWALHGSLCCCCDVCALSNEAIAVRLPDSRSDQQPAITHPPRRVHFTGGAAAT